MRHQFTYYFILVIFLNLITIKIAGEVVDASVLCWGGCRFRVFCRGPSVLAGVYCGFNLILSGLTIFVFYYANFFATGSALSYSKTSFLLWSDKILL
jgi:hypothetical protein